MADRYWVGTTTAWTSSSNWSTTSGGPGGASVPTASDNAIINKAGTYTVSIGSPSACLNLTVSVGTVTLGVNDQLSIYGDLNLSAATVSQSSTSVVGLVFSATSGTQNITTNGAVLGFNLVCSGGSTVKLQDNCTVSYINNKTVTLSNGTLDLNGKTLTTIFFNSSGTTARTLAFGVGKIVLTGPVASVGPYTVWTTADPTNLTVTGTPVVDFTNSNGILTSTMGLITGSMSEANAISFNVKASNACTVNMFQANHSVKNLNFAGFTGTLNSHGGSATIYGNCTFSTGMTVNSSSANGAFVFSGGSNQTITSNGKSFCASVTMDKTGGTLTLADALSLDTAATVRSLTFANGVFDGTSKTISSAGSSTLSSTGTVICKNINTARPITLISGTLTQGAANTFGAVTLNNGTFDGGGFTTTGAFTMATGSATAQNIVIPSTFTHTSGTLTFGANNTTGAYTHTAGTLDLAGYQLTCTTFASNNANARTIAFGTGNITCTGTGTVWLSSTATNLTTTGTPVVNVTNSGSVATGVTPGVMSEANAISFNFTAGTYALSFLGSTGNTAKNVNFTGFAGIWNARTVTHIIYGNLTLSSGMTFAASTGNVTLGATSGTQVITTNGKTYDSPIAQNGVGGTVRLADALTLGASRQFTHTNGTLDLNGKTLTTGSVLDGYRALAGGTQNITFNGGTVVVSIGTNNTPFTVQAGANLTTTAGTGVGKISYICPAGAFLGPQQNVAFNCTISNDGAGPLRFTAPGPSYSLYVETITTTNGSLAFGKGNAASTLTVGTLSTAIRPLTITFDSGLTYNINNWDVSGTAGNLVTITSSSSGSPATLSKASGVVSADYLSIQDSAATGGATWYAGANSTNVSGNSGWIFTASPNTGAFFFLF